MIDHFEPDDPSKYIITADRGYESYDLLFHCELKKLFYVFRVKAPTSGRSMLSSFIDELPDDQPELDVEIKRFYTDKHTNIMKDQSEVYHYINPYKDMKHFYMLLKNKHVYYMRFRVLKIKTGENTFEYIITNLPYTFDPNDIKDIYHWRWGIEVSFRYLKHAAGLLHFHSRKPEFVKQEIYARAIMYNFGIFIANNASRESKKTKRDPDNKYVYEIDLIKLLSKYIHPIKTEFRQFSRSLRGIGAIHFGYC